MNESPPLLEVSKLSKRFPGVQALSQVDLRLERGEVLALIGESRGRRVRSGWWFTVYRDNKYIARVRVLGRPASAPGRFKAHVMPKFLVRGRSIRIGDRARSYD